MLKCADPFCVLQKCGDYVSITSDVYLNTCWLVIITINFAECFSECGCSFTSESHRNRAVSFSAKQITCSMGYRPVIVAGY